MLTPSTTSQPIPIVASKRKGDSSACKENRERSGAQRERRASVHDVLVQDKKWTAEARAELHAANKSGTIKQIHVLRTGSPCPESDTPLDVSAKQAQSKGQSLSVADFELLCVLGKGAFGKVFQVRKRDSGKIFAMKVLRKAFLIESDAVKQTNSEREVLAAVNHPFLVRLRYAFQSDTKLYLILDFVSGGDLATHLALKSWLPEDDVRFYAAELVVALEHLHSQNIIYRDLKPENIMLTADGHVCLTDFGLAKSRVQREDAAKTMCGTKKYMAPEIFQKSGHGAAVDWWALGVVIHELLTGETPFDGANDKETQQKVLSGKIALSWSLSKNCRSLLTALLKRPVNQRLGSGAGGAEDVKNHSFFAGIDWKLCRIRGLTPPFTPNLANDEDIKSFSTKFTKLRPVDSPAASQNFPNIFKGFSFSSEQNQQPPSSSTSLPASKAPERKPSASVARSDSQLQALISAFRAQLAYLMGSTANSPPRPLPLTYKPVLLLCSPVSSNGNSDAARPATRIAAPSKRSLLTAALTSASANKRTLAAKEAAPMFSGSSVTSAANAHGKSGTRRRKRGNRSAAR